MAYTSGARHLLRVFLLGCLTVSCSGCGLGYLWHVTVGQAKLLAQQRPVDEVLRGAQLTDQERQKMQLILAVRTFAIAQLGLYDSSSYTTFVRLARPYVSYNLSAAPADAFKPYVWRFPVLGAMPYKGFFNLEYAEQEQQELEAQGYETYLRGVRAYSTLGYFDDPILSSMLAYDDVVLINTIIHEMLHQTVWIKGSVSFNESLASFIGAHGTRMYLTQRYGPGSPAVQRYDALQADKALFEAYMQALLTRVEALYQEPISRTEKLQRREQLFTEAVTGYTPVAAQMRTTQYQKFFERRALNNAVLLAFRTYNRDPAFFERLLAAQGGDLRRLIVYCKTLRTEQIPEGFRTR